MHSSKPRAAPGGAARGLLLCMWLKNYDSVPKMS